MKLSGLDLAEHRIYMVDVDGCLADFVLGFTTLGNAFFGTPIVKTVDRPSWKSLGGMDAIQRNHVWRFVEESTTFWRDLTPLISSRGHKWLRAICEANDVYFVTGRVGSTARAQTIEWLQDRLGINRPQVIVTSRKGEIAEAIGADYAIDDKASNASCIAWLTLNECKSYLLDRPYNRVHGDFLASSVQRVDSLEEFFKETIGVYDA